MTYSIWLVPSIQDGKYVKKMIRNLAKEYGAPVFLPHITVYGGITRRSAAIDAVRSCRGLPKLTVRANAIRTSDYLWKTLYLDIKPNARLCKIHQTCKRTLGRHVMYKFKPHMSLMYKKMDRTTKTGITKNLKIKRTYLFDRMVLIQSSSKVSEWKVITSARLS
ncbi:MAG: 2'-5' RNA ligase family protein [Candidatus Nitrosotenuis sp.]|nr:2'-5' RNA ligase family protein [Candidatus Nitrosotenuis sp.]